MTSTSPTSTLYIGTYTDNQAPVEQRSEGIYQARLDWTSGELTDIQLAAPAVNACFLALAPSRRYLYAVGDTLTSEQNPGGAVGAFAIDNATGQLRLVNQQPAPGGRPCHVTTDATGRFVVTANYGQGSAALYPITADGRVAPPSAVIQHSGNGPNPARQAGPHAHQATFSPDNRLVLINDLGLDKVLLYRLDTTESKLIPNDSPWATVHGGAGPRHLAFHPSGHYVYVINELDSTMTVFQYEAASGTMTAIQVISTLPAGFTGENSCADIHVHQTGRFLYGSNRGHDSIASFAIDEGSGRLTALGHQSTLGEVPRNFAIDPSGAFLLAANQKSGTLATFRIDQQSGGLTPTGQVAHIPAPSCVKFM